MIKRIKLKHFRSYGPTGVDLEGMSKINILIGPNNSGKTNFIQFIKFLHQARNFYTGANVLNPHEYDDYYDHNQANIIEFALYPELSPRHEELIAELSVEPYFTFQVQGTGAGASLQLVDSFLHNPASEALVRKLAMEARQISGGEFRERLDDVLSTSLKPVDVIGLPEILYIDDSRQINLNEGIRTKIHELLHFDHRTQRVMRPRRERLIDFVSEVIGRRVDLQMPSPDKELEVRMDNEPDWKPLHLIGMGVHEVISLALYLTGQDKSLVCIDEPELHLHPKTQRSFLKYIAESTDHQYILTTHSNAFIDLEVEKSLYSVTLKNGETTLEACTNTATISAILHEMGVRPSEILQVNGLIWVEGPSDRVYIKRWMEVAGLDWVEGLHYTFQYYAGSLLKHYSLEDEEFTEFINALSLNRNAYFVMDSDMDKQFVTSDLSPAKQRIIEESSELGIGTWVTAGYTIENYLTKEQIGTDLEKGKSLSKYSNPADSIKGYADKYGKSKLIAPRITSLDNPEQWDLISKIEEINQFIARWNGR